jgi:hypothetical protein
MRWNLSQVVAPAALLAVASVAWGQAFRSIPRPGPMPGGGHTAPHIPIPGLGDSDFGMYCIIVVSVIAVVVLGFCLGSALGQRWRGVPPAAQANGFMPPQSQRAPVPPMKDLILSPDEVMDKCVRTTRLLEMLARSDRLFNPGPLRDWVHDLFCHVQQCWQERNPAAVEEQLTPKALARYEDLIRTMRGNHLINRVDDLRLWRLEFIHVAHPEEADRHEFTVLITFDAKAYFVDERTGIAVHGEPKNSWFQEFWTFRRYDDAWRLHEVNESWDSGPLTALNQVAGLSEVQLHNAEGGVSLL